MSPRTLSPTLNAILVRSCEQRSISSIASLRRCATDVQLQPGQRLGHRHRHLSGVQTVADINEPFAIVMGSEDAERAYVSAVSAAYDSIEVIDTSSNAVIATHPLASA